MNQHTKQQLLECVRKHIAYIRERIEETIAMRVRRSAEMAKEAIKLPPDAQMAQRRIAAHYREEAENLKQLYPSPYFSKCVFETKGEMRELYFGKFSLSDERVYSWITPAAALRFEDPGNASYTRPDGGEESGMLHAKDQYMIVDGKVLFFATESMDHKRELVHQEHFTHHKKGFILPEVIEQMEKAQDQVIRAWAQGPFVITGPAGSGKTTLALHRVAYLAQSPETAEYFKPETMLVLVQDSSTKEYFSRLLPELGIQGVRIATFSEWALNVLGIDRCAYTSGYGRSQLERHWYEYAKLTGLRTRTHQPYTKNMFTLLARAYENAFTPQQKNLFAQQKGESVLDRCDLTILLESYYRTHGNFTQEKEYYEETKNGTYRKKRGTFPILYNLLIIDEFQNYLPEQLTLLKRCVNNRLESVVYVGDMAQQTQLGTIRQWSDIGEVLPSDRLVTLQKVYRNTKQILTYIRSLGFDVVIPKEMKEGKEVMVYHTETPEAELAIIQHHVPNDPNMTVGILSQEKDYVAYFKEQCKSPNIKCLSFQEAQGVEFDIVFIVGVGRDQIQGEEMPETLLQEIKKVERDLFYVALTRAMNELYVLGNA